MAKDAETGDLFEADGVTPKAAEKPAITLELLEAEKRAARAEGKAEGLEKAVKAAPKAAAQAEKVWSRAELRAQVNDGKITEDQMDETLERQLKASLTKAITETVTTEVTAKTNNAKAQEDIARYLSVFPDINKEGHELRARVEQEFKELVAEGANANSYVTELKAIKAACGPLKTEGRRAAPDSHEETGGRGATEKPDADGPFKGVPARTKAHYEKLIARGVYRGTSDPKLLKELNFARRAN